jgi:Pregnancy-associated plasma protein-A
VSPSRARTAAPTIRQCGTMPVHERLLRSDADYLAARTASENRAFDARNSDVAIGRVGITEIPVVVHVLFNTKAQNISDAQITSQIDVLNEDFRATNADLASIPPVFAPLATDTRLTFRLATVDPDGSPTDGITRTKTDKTAFSSADDDAKAAATGGHDAWPADRYLNLWVVPSILDERGEPGIIGYAQFPGGAPATDGVVILQTAFGRTGTAKAPFNLGRTATHEIGHWLNLRHIWGDDGNGCNGDDFVSDTPNAAGPNFGKKVFPHVTCGNGPNGDLFVNYMDYSDDAAMFMFTAGQVERMQACLDGDRASIGQAVANA